MDLTQMQSSQHTFRTVQQAFYFSPDITAFTKGNE